MRAAAVSLKTWLANNNVAFRADLFTITLADGVTKYRWTTAEIPITTGGNTFATPSSGNGAAPLVTRSGYSQACRLSVDTLDLTLGGGSKFTIGGKTLQQLAITGYFDGARVQVDHLIGTDVVGAVSTLNGGLVSSFFEGRVAQVEPRGPTVLMRLKSELITLSQLLPKFLLMPQCCNAVYDANCGLNRATFTLAGAADATPTTTSIHTSSGVLTAKAAGYFNLGVLRFTSGGNNGIARAVQSWDGHTFVTYLPFPLAPVAGDTFTVYPGCDRSKTSCVGKFTNSAQYRGYPHIPSPEAGSGALPARWRVIQGGRKSDPAEFWSLVPGGRASNAELPPGQLPTTGNSPNTTSDQAVPLPIAYGTVKVGSQLIEMAQPVPKQPPAWAPGAYKAGDIVGANGGAWKAMSSATATANQAPGSGIGPFKGPQGGDPPDWVGNTFWAAGAIVKQNGSVYQAMNAGGGVSGSFGPYFGGVSGSAGSVTGTQIVDNGVVWQYLGVTPFPVWLDYNAPMYWRYLQQLPYPTYTQVFLAALCEGEVTGAVSLFWDKERYAVQTATDLGHQLKLYKGPDAANQVLTGPFDSAGYQHTVAVGPATTAGVFTESQKELPQLAVELKSVMFGSAVPDVNPADILNDILTHTRRGCSWLTSQVDSVTVTSGGASSMRTYCDAAGFRFSMLIDSQRDALSIVADVLNACNCDAVWSGGTLKVVPLGDQNIASPVYGSTAYVAPNTAQYNLGVIDFLKADGASPVQVSRTPDPECFNDVPVEYIDRSMIYQRNTVEDPDQTDIEKRGSMWRGSTMSLPVVYPNGTYPIALSRAFAQRSLNVRNIYTFRLPWRYLLLEPTDVVTLTEPALGLNLTPVRITQMREAADYTWEVTAEEYPQGVAAPGTYTPQPGDGYQPNAPGTSGSLPQAYGVGALTMQPGANLWPNPTSEINPPPYVPVANDGTQPEWDYRAYVAPVPRSTGALAGVEGTSPLTLNAPPGVAAGDVVLAFLFLQGGTGQTVTPPAGWTLVRRDNAGTTYGQAVYWALGSVASYAFALSAGGLSSGYAVAYTGVDTSSPVDVSGGQTNASSTNAVAPTVTPTLANDLLVAVYGYLYTLAASTVAITPPVGEVERTPLGGTVGQGAFKISGSTPTAVAVSAADELLTAAGATGTRTATLAIACANAGQLIALKSPSGIGAHTGSWVRRWTSVNGTIATPVVIPCSQDEIVQFSVWAWNSAASGRAGVSIEFLDANGVALTGGASSVTAATVWTLIKCSARAPAGTVKLRASLSVNGTGTESMYLDDMLLRKLPPAGPVGGIQRGSGLIPDCTLADIFEVIISGPPGPWAMNTPRSPYVGMNIMIKIMNQAGGAITNAVWGFPFQLAGNWVDAVNGSNRSVLLHYDGTHWLEISRSAADVLN